MANILQIDLNEESLAELLINHADDWTEVLSFLENVVISRGGFLPYDTVSNIIRAEYEKE